MIKIVKGICTTCKSEVDVSLEVTDTYWKVIEFNCTCGNVYPQPKQEFYIDKLEIGP